MHCWGVRVLSFQAALLDAGSGLTACPAGRPHEPTFLCKLTCPSLGTGGSGDIVTEVNDA